MAVSAASNASVTMKQMLKSHLRLHGIQHDVPEVEAEQLVEEAAPIPGDKKKGVKKIVVIEDDADIQHRALNRSEISVRLSWIGKTAEGDAYTYLKAQCTHMKLTDITCIRSFKHLQFVDVSNNFLTSEALQVVTELPSLLLIHADQNRLQTAKLKMCKYLQVIILNYNYITTIEDVYQPQLRTLELGYNHITEINIQHSMNSVIVLDLRYNLITELGELNFPKLDSLYLAGNKITSLVGIDRLKLLRVLNVRNNPIKVLDGFETKLPKLEYLNLRNCKIRSLKQVKKLENQNALRILILRGTPFMGGSGKEVFTREEDDPDIRIDVLAALPHLIRLNKDFFTPDDRLDGDELRKKWQESDEEESEELESEEEEEEQL